MIANKHSENLFHIFHIFRLSMVSTGGKLFVNPGPEYRNSSFVTFYRFFSLHKRKKANGRNTDGLLSPYLLAGLQDLSFRYQV
jgi:hypothetical protein